MLLERLRQMGYHSQQQQHQPLAMDSFQQPNFALVAGLLRWLLRRQVYFTYSDIPRIPRFSYFILGYVYYIYI